MLIFILGWRGKGGIHHNTSIIRRRKCSIWYICCYLLRFVACCCSFVYRKYGTKCIQRIQIFFSTARMQNFSFLSRGVVGRQFVFKIDHKESLKKLKIFRGLNLITLHSSWKFLPRRDFRSLMMGKALFVFGVCIFVQKI